MVILFPSSVNVTTPLGLSKCSFLIWVTPVEASSNYWLQSAYQFCGKELPHFWPVPDSMSQQTEPSLLWTKFVFRRQIWFTKAQFIVLWIYIPIFQPNLVCVIPLVGLISSHVGWTSSTVKPLHIIHTTELVFRLFGVFSCPFCAHTTTWFEVIVVVSC